MRVVEALAGEELGPVNKVEEASHADLVHAPLVQPPLLLPAHRHHLPLFPSLLLLPYFVPTLSLEVWVCAVPGRTRPLG